MFEMAENPAAGVIGTETGGDSVAAVNNTPSTPSQPAGSGAAGTPETLPDASGLPEFTEGAPGSPEAANPEAAQKPTPKEVSEAINRATERYQKKLDYYQKRDEKTVKMLKDVGLPGDIDIAAAQIVATANNIPLSEAISKQTAARDMQILGKADAAEIIEHGDIEAEIKRLADKPIPLRTERDRICYKELVDAKKLSDEAEALEKIGVDVEKLKKDGAFAEFNKKLNPDLPIAERYEMYKKTLTAAPAATPPPSVASKGGTPKKEFFTSEEVDAMTPEEVEKYLPEITRSMAKW